MHSYRRTGLGYQPKGPFTEGFADHVEQLSKVITYTPRPGRHSSAVEQLFRKSPALCAVLHRVEARYKRAHLSAIRFEGCPSRIDAAGRERPNRA